MFFTVMVTADSSRELKHLTETCRLSFCTRDNTGHLHEFLAVDYYCSDTLSANNNISVILLARWRG